ncbi:MAG: hypothetical protein IJU63_02275 [Bacteroidales bacterium]|nr:hypothetical protein [Bacteroidales bacterium]
MNRQDRYTAPDVLLVDIHTESVLCQSPLQFYNPNSAGDNIKPEDINDEGGF